jgi:hypothetical protein
VGYVNPLLALPAAKKLLLLSAKERAATAAVFTELRHQANDLAEASWKRKKGPMAAYYRAVSTYARHVAHVLRRGLAEESEGTSEATGRVLLSDLAAARRQVELLINAAKVAVPVDEHPLSNDAEAWATRLREMPLQRPGGVGRSIPAPRCGPRHEQAIDVGGRDD